MAYTGLRLEGGRQLRRTLRQAGVDMRELKGANRAAGSIVTGRAQGWAPRVSGRLASSVRTGATQTAAIVRAGNNRKSASGVPYAGPIHWGWRARNITPNPFLSYSAQATEPKWVEIYYAHLNKTIDKVKGI